MKIMGMNEVCEEVGCKYQWLRWEIEQKQLVQPLKVGSSKIFTDVELAIIKKAYENRPSLKYKN